MAGMSLPTPSISSRARRPGDEFADTVPESPAALPPPAMDRDLPLRPGAAIGCPQCRAPMRHLSLPGHHAPATVDVDHCGPCGLVWFDARESVHLSTAAWIQLLRDLHRLRRGEVPHQPDRACPLCAKTLKEVRNFTRYGRFPVLECGSCGGHLHSQAGMLAERGLVRPLLPGERYALQAEKRQCFCLSCGGPADGKGEDCAWCKSPLLMVDMPRLANALRKRSPSEPLLMPNGGKPVGWACRGCGAPMDPTRETRCGQCHHTVVAPSLDDLGPLLDALEHDGEEADAQIERERRERRERLAAYPFEHRDPAGGRHGLFWKGKYEKRYDAENQRREERRDGGIGWASSGWPGWPGSQGDGPPSLIGIALRIAARLLWR